MSAAERLATRHGRWTVSMLRKKVILATALEELRSQQLDENDRRLAMSMLNELRALIEDDQRREVRDPVTQ